MTTPNVIFKMESINEEEATFEVMRLTVEQILKNLAAIVVNPNANTLAIASVKKLKHGVWRFRFKH